MDLVAKVFEGTDALLSSEARFTKDDKAFGWFSPCKPDWPLARRWSLSGALEKVLGENMRYCRDFDDLAHMRAGVNYKLHVALLGHGFNPKVEVFERTADFASVKKVLGYVLRARM